MNAPGPAIERSLFAFIWKYSKRDQFVLLVATALLFPLLYLTLELPKRIINDAIDASQVPISAFGTEFTQIEFLALLSAAFLVAVLMHGLLKMRINTMKGILAERMLRRFRYRLIARILRFPQPYFERTSQGELVSMITAESEPMGGLMGDALAQPVLQAGQMLTILAFLFLQSVWFGLAACAMIPLQAWLIPKLQRQVNQLNKKRVAQVRALAAQIGENATGAASLRVNGGWRYRLALVTDRLGKLYAIRFEIYQKKFFMKFLNNFITQLTPFFFFSVGGYLVIRGNVSLGALVAALAAYKDLSSPWKELLTYYNQTQDMAMRWDIITERFAPPGMLDEALFDGMPDTIPRLSGDVRLSGVTVCDSDGNVVLENIDATFPAGSAIGIAAPSEEDRRALAALLTREVLPASGRVTVGETDLSALHQAAIAGRIGHATSRPVLFQGTFGDNMMLPLRARPLSGEQEDADAAEALRAGNSPDPLNARWEDPALAGTEDAAALRNWWLRILESMGRGTGLFRRGLDQAVDPVRYPELGAILARERPAVLAALTEKGLDAAVHRFDFDAYNPAFPLADNLLFAVPRRRVSPAELSAQTEFLALLRALGIEGVLIRLARDIVEVLRQSFGQGGTDHPLFRKLNLDPATYEAAAQLVARLPDEAESLADGDLALLLAVAFAVSAEQFGAAFPEELQARVLQLRLSHSGALRESLGDLYAPLDPETCTAGLTVLENALFGRIAEGAAVRAEDVRKVVADTLSEHGARRSVIEMIFDLPVTLGGSNLPALFAEPLAFARATIKRPDILILDQALSSFGAESRVEVVEGLRELLPETLVIWIADRLDEAMGFDAVFELRQGRMVSEADAEEIPQGRASGADLAQKVRALEGTPLFEGLSRRQLRLLAFGSRWYEAEAGSYVFSRGDDPVDGAYMVLEGEAGLYLPQDCGTPRLVAKVGPGTLVGELGLIRKVPRALDMKAETALKCLRIGEEEFIAVVENDAATAFRLLQTVAGYVSN